MDSALNTAFNTTRSFLFARVDDITTAATAPTESFFEQHKTMIIAAGAMVPLQIIAGFFYMKRRKAKKIAAAELEERITRLEMGQQQFGNVSQSELHYQK